MRIRKERLLSVASLVAAIALAPTAFGQKIDPRVRERAQSEAAVPVFIVLEHQPQREIFQRAESANALYREVAESRQSREAAEAVVRRTRRQAFQAIEQAIGPEQDALEGRLKGLGATRISRYLGINMLAAEIPATEIAALEADPAVARVSAVEKVYPQLATSVPALGAPAFWNAGYTGQGESVGVLDTGVRTNHPAFAGVPIVSQVFLTNGSTDPCFADDASSAEDQFGHGTHVAGIVASQGSAGWTNYQGVAKGIGTLYNLKVGYVMTVSNSCGSQGAQGDQRDILAAVDWAVRNTSLKIFNLSFGNAPTGDDDDFAQSIDQYIDNYGLTFAIAAGNGGMGGYGVTSPGIGYNGITVGNWVSRGTMNPSSSRGTTVSGRYKPDLAAPGTSIYSTAYNWDARAGTSDDFVSMTGTSMAAPHIAGAAALLGSAGVSDPLAVKALMINTADNQGYWQNDAGWGYTNLGTALGQLNYITDSIESGGFRFYRMAASGSIRSTITWNRHVSGDTSNFNIASLRLFQADSGDEIVFYTGYHQNVIQAFGSYTGDVVLAVNMMNSPLAGVASEPFAIAFSAPAVPIIGPRIIASCDVPPSIAAGSQFTVTCSVSNYGGLPLPVPTAQITLPFGFTAGPQTP
ncbi:MAG TPA: S8 family serine peptidase, partial [Bryobacteraceae bacterium]|nr:S8 family serine peptidase [Bryobacteraceae bacterium]